MKFQRLVIASRKENGNVEYFEKIHVHFKLLWIKSSRLSRTGIEVVDQFMDEFNRDNSDNSEDSA